MMQDWTVRQVMTQSVITLDPADTVQEAARRLAENRITGAPVVSEGQLVGMITEHDIVQAMLPPKPVDGGLSLLDILTHLDDVRNRPSKRTVGEAMRRLVVETSPGASLWEAAAEMQSRGINRLPVMDGGRLVGIVSRADIVRVMGEETTSE